ncbi:MAG: M12 family metallo-peptidase [Planctomycetota bacterium]|nr:M12 family metallo-peptidase [Planctomycetota bacterium]
MSLGLFLVLATSPVLGDRPLVTLPSPLVPSGHEQLTGPDGLTYPTPIFSLDPEGLDELSHHEAVRLAGWPLPGGGSVDLTLERLPVAASSTGGQLFVDGLPSGRLIGQDTSLWSGRIEGQPGSDVFLALGAAGSRGWVRTGGERPHLSHLLAEPHPVLGWDAALARVVDEAALGFAPATACETAALPDGGLLPGRVPGPNHRANIATPELGDAPPKLGLMVPVMRELTVAVETDYQFFSLFGNLGAAEAYAVSLMGAVSARYREQFDTVLTLPYLSIYTTPTDPWISQDLGLSSVDLLYEFQSAWYAGMPVDASLGHFLSGAGLGGGVAWLDTLCVPEYRFGVSGNLGANLPLPVTQGPLNWDFVVVAHEIGHNLSTLHTHDYCPPIDECAPSGYFGACQTKEVCITNGTVMSYCHLCSGGLANVTTYFHPTVVQTIKARVADSCLPPFEGLFLKGLGGAIAGSKGEPKITPTFAALTDDLGLDFAKAPSPSSAVLVFGTSQANLPLLGGILVPTPQALVPFPTSASTGSLPPLSFAGIAIPAGVKFYVQAWFADVVTPFGFSASAGVELELVIPDPPKALTWFPHPTNGREYALAPSASWFKGEATAQQHGGHLASLTSPAVEAWLKTTFVDSGLLSGSAYIGFNDQASEGSFSWISGDPASYTNWASGEPNDFNGYEDYAAWNGGPWNDIDGYVARPALIQR